jgi:hypothetical protein
VDEDDDGGFGFDLRIDDEGLDGAVAVLEIDVLVVAGRGVEAGLGPVLRVEGSDGQGEEQSGGEELDGAGQADRRGYRQGYLHGGSLVLSVRGGQGGADDFSRSERKCILQKKIWMNDVQRVRGNV